MLGQGNLVTNGDFEIMDTCPYSGGQGDIATGWTVYQSADYLNACGSSNYSVPTNIFGHQAAYSGQAYCLLATFAYTQTLDFNYREFLQTELVDTLKPGAQYCLKFYISIAEGASQFITSNIGAAFSVSPTNPIQCNPPCSILMAADVENLSYTFDTASWVEVNLKFIANGGEKWLTIGNFRTDSSTSYSFLHNVNSIYSGMYIDNVSLYRGIEADAGQPNSICIGDTIQIGADSIPYLEYQWISTAPIFNSPLAKPWVTIANSATYVLTISDPLGLYCISNSTDSVVITAMPCQDSNSFYVPTIIYGNQNFVIDSLIDNTALNIYDLQGRYVYRDSEYNNNWNANCAAQNVYIYEIIFPSGIIRRGKLLIIK